MNKRLYNFIALLLLGLFFAPYVILLQQWDLIILLIGGMLLPIADFFIAPDE